MANANIFQQYLQPVKTVADFNAEADGQDLRRQQLIGAQRQNALAALIAQQQTQTMSDTAADRNALSRIAAGWSADTSPDARIAALRNSGRPALMQQADTLEKQWLDRRKTDADIGKTSAETGEIGAKTVDKVVGTYRATLDTIQSPQDAAQWLAAQYQDPALRDHMTRMAPFESAVAKIPTDPQGFMAWKQQAGMGMEKYAAFVAPKPVETRLGNRVAFVDMNPNSPTYKQQVAGAAIAQSPDSAAQVAEQARAHNMADARARDKNTIDRDAVGKVEWKQDTDGNWVALPKEVKDGQPVTPIRTTVPGKREVQAGHAIDIINQARGLIDSATGSYVGAGIDKAAQAIGVGTSGAEAGAKLKALEGALMMAQPRMEGPQSDKDVMLYRQMAGQIGDPTVPASIKTAAIDEVERLHRKYAPNAPKGPAPAAGAKPTVSNW